VERTSIDLAGASMSALFGLVTFCLFTMVGCEAPWWFYALGAPLFAFASFRASRLRTSIVQPSARFIATSVLMTSTLFLVVSIFFSAIFLARDLEKYGTAFRIGCGDARSGESVACRDVGSR